MRLQLLRRGEDQRTPGRGRLRGCGASASLAEALAEAGAQRALNEAQRLEHPTIVRICHWLAALAVPVLIASGLEVFAAFPSFGDKIPFEEFLVPPAGPRLGGWLGGALQWHDVDGIERVALTQRRNRARRGAASSAFESCVSAAQKIRYRISEMLF